MNKREIASLGCKLLGIYMIIQGINVMSNIFSLMITTSGQSTPDYLTGFIFPFLFLIVFGIILWLLSDRLAGIMVKGKTRVQEDPGLKASDMQRVSFSVVGLLLLGNSIPKLVSFIIGLTLMRETPYAITPNLYLFYQGGGVISQFILGLGIFLGSQGLVNLLNAIRSAGPKQNNIHKD
ncbi:MAG: hypothetical protein ACYCX4_02135 [Bacillota bacterium]